MRQLICIVTICYLYTKKQSSHSSQDLYNLIAEEESRHLLPKHYEYSAFEDSDSYSADSYHEPETAGQKNQSEPAGPVPQLRESFVSNQNRKYKANGKDLKTLPKHANATPEQYKNIFTLEDKLKKIQECRKKDRKKKVKFNVAANEDILIDIEIDPDCLVILEDHATTGDDSNNADRLAPNTLDRNGNINYHSEPEDYDQQNLFEDYMSQKRQYRGNNKYYVNKLFKKLYNQSHKILKPPQNQDYEDQDASNDSESYKNIHVLVDDRLKKIQECKKKSKRNSGKGRASKHASDLIDHSDCLDILDDYSLDNLDQYADNLDIYNDEYLYDRDRFAEEPSTQSHDTDSRPARNQRFFAIPEGFERNAKKVVAGALATAVIDNEGALKFWFNRRDDSPEGVRTFEGYSNGKVSLSKRFFCAINDVRELSCYGVKETQATLKKLQIPRSLKEGVVDVSAGEEQVCAVSANSAVTCWRYNARGSTMLYVPNSLRKPYSALGVHTSDSKHCAVGVDATLTCWGSAEGRKYKEQFADSVRQVSVGNEYFCYVKFTGELQCYSTALGRTVGVPAGFTTHVQQVSVGSGHVCAVKGKAKRYGKALCWNYEKGVSPIPLEVSRTNIVDISAGQQHICAINKRGKLSCWPVEY